MKASQPLSTSALAKALQRSVRQMFAELAVMGWIRREDEQWQLTAKGEFEGGVYRESKRFGRYIVWPPTILEHRALVQTRKQHLTASAIGREYGLSATLVNRLLAERGWIRADGRGWRLTDTGRAEGGVQRDDERSGIPYVVWSPDINAHPVMLRALQCLRSEPDRDASLPVRSLDGHSCRNAVCAQVCNWLYLAGIVHAVDVALPVEEALYCDFYIPSLQLFIDDCSDEAEAIELAARINRQHQCERHGLELLRITAQDAEDIDNWLPRELRRRGLDV